MVALQPDESAQRTAREQDEAHEADGFEAALLYFHLFLGNRDPRRHFLFDPGLFGPGWLGVRFVLGTAAQQEQGRQHQGSFAHYGTLLSVGSRPGSQAMHSVLNWHHEQCILGCG